MKRVLLFEPLPAGPNEIGNDGQRLQISGKKKQGQTTLLLKTLYLKKATDESASSVRPE